MADQIDFQCRNCGKSLSARPKHAGKRTKCPACKQPVRVPGLELESNESSDGSIRPSRPKQNPEPINVASAQPDETIQAALREAEQFSKLINESLQNASTSDEPAAKLKEIAYAKQNLDLLKQHLATNPTIELSSFGDLEDRVVTLDSAFEQAGLRRLVANTHPAQNPPQPQFLATSTSAVEGGPGDNGKTAIPVQSTDVKKPQATFPGGCGCLVLLMIGGLLLVSSCVFYAISLPNERDPRGYDDASLLYAGREQLKKTLNDPDSLQIISEEIIPAGDGRSTEGYRAVYRAKNGFGGYVEDTFETY